jgi:diaminopimelate epimerase
MACGSGACAVAVAGSLLGHTGREVHVHLPGGTLDVDWSAGGVFLSGPVQEVFRGTLDERFELALLAAAAT